MPLSRKRMRELKREQRRLKVKSIMSPADVRAMRRAGLDPEKIGNETGKVSSSVYYALLREKEAIEAHLSWHHDSVKFPDIRTILERMQIQLDEQGALVRLQAQRITLLEAERVLEDNR